MSELSKEFWNKYFRVYDVLNLVIPYQELLLFVVEKLEIRSDDLVLDAGSGTGNLSVLIKEKGAQVIGIDSSEEAIKRNYLKDKKAKIIKGDLSKNLPFKSDYFNKVACVNVLYSIATEKRKAVLKELFRVLKKRGLLVLTIPVEKKPINIYFDHIRKDLKRSGLFRALWNLIKFIPDTVRMIFYNRKIIKTTQNEFINQQQIESLMKEVGFQVNTIQRVYSNQSIAVVGVKK